jgi:iron-sulfur cluster assembly accessory protein
MLTSLVSRSFAKSVLSLTPTACERIHELMKEQDTETIGIKLGIKRRGCNGLSYTMNYTKEIKKLDEVVEADGLKVVVESNAVMYLLGTTMDYIITPLAEEFVFRNPNAKGECGCGESFNV